jgi:hypothetical protein
MNTKSVILGSAIAALSLAALGVSPAKAETGAADHAAAIEACSAVNPFQPVEALSAVDDGSGIGFGLVWIGDAEDRLWMCDADAEGFVYSYSLMTADLLEGTGPELIGLTPASNGGFEDDPQAVAEKVCVGSLEDGGTVLSSRPTASAPIPATRSSWRTRPGISISATPRATPWCGLSSLSASRFSLRMARRPAKPVEGHSNGRGASALAPITMPVPASSFSIRT